MKDVAAAAGVALKTVSRVVNDEPGVNAATAERVRVAIQTLGYSRNESARVLRQGRTASIGLVIEDVADPFYSGLSRAVEDVAIKHGCLVLSGSSSEQPERERELVLTFCARRVDGLIIVPAGSDHSYLRPELDAGTPAVFVDRPPGPNLDVDTVLCDNAGGARLAVEHLRRHGHRRIAFLGDSPAIFTAAERLRGYRDALGPAGIDERLVSMALPSLERVRADLDRMLALDDPPTALFTGNGRLTVAALRALAGRPPAVAGQPPVITGQPPATAGQPPATAGQPPATAGQPLATAGQPLAMVGFDDFELADLLRPGVSVIAQNPAELGRTAAELLFRRLAGHDGPAEHLRLPTRLIPRGSGELPAAVTG